MGMNLNDFLKLTKSMCHSVNQVKSPLYKNEQRLPSDGKPSVKIWQIFYEPGQIANLDLDFEPYDWLCNPHPEYTETLHFINLHKSGKYREADYTGIVSNKFGFKTGLTGERFIQFIKNNPGYDVYFVNPFPELGYFWLNVWRQGEFRHPGLIKLAQKLFEITATPVKIDSLGRNDQTTLLYSNYWVGNKKFWDAFMSFLIPLFHWIDKEAAPPERKPYFRRAPYANAGFSMFSFIFERLFSTFLLVGKDISGCAFNFNKNEILDKCGNQAYRNLIEKFGALIDTLDRLSIFDDELGGLSQNILRDLMTLKIDTNLLNQFRTELQKY